MFLFLFRSIILVNEHPNHQYLKKVDDCQFSFALISGDDFFFWYNINRDVCVCLDILNYPISSHLSIVINIRCSLSKMINREFPVIIWSFYIAIIWSVLLLSDQNLKVLFCFSVVVIDIYRLLSIVDVNNNDDDDYNGGKIWFFVFIV